MVFGSLVAMPFIVLNMGGEMIYILNQRLQAQNIPADKGKKVLADVIRTMYTAVFLDELFKPQEVYTRASTKQIFDKLAHSSVMRLNKTSMDKLYDLMTMGVKYQLLSCKSPHQYLQLTLNHLDTLVDMVHTEGVTDLIHIATNRMIAMYSNMSNGNWLLLEQTLMDFYQDKKIKVSLFLQKDFQTLSGSFVLDNKGRLPYGTELPGQIRCYEDNNVVYTKTYPHELTDKCFLSNQILEQSWRIGYNVYSNVDEVERHQPIGDSLHIESPAKSKFDRLSVEQTSLHQASKAFASNHISWSPSLSSPLGDDMSRHSVPGVAIGAPGNFTPAEAKPSKHHSSAAKSSAKAGLSLLSDLLGIHDSAKDGTSKDGDDKLFRINLFPNEAFLKNDDDDDPHSYSKSGDDSSSGYITIDIDASATAGTKSMSSYMNDLHLDWDESRADAKDSAVDDDDDLLALMDSTK